MSGRRPVASRILSMLDLTNLDNDCSDDKVVELCRRAVTPWGSVAAVCVWPAFVPLARRLLVDSEIKVATVVNFPEGASDPVAAVTETTEALSLGADEIDVVAPYRALANGDDAIFRTLVRSVRDSIGDRAVLKVILETGELVEPTLIETAARLAIEGGADFIKTSTGKTPVSATVEAVSVMLRTIRASGRVVGIKPSGGIRSFDDASRYLDVAEAVMGPAWVTPRFVRFGASSLLDALERELA